MTARIKLIEKPVTVVTRITASRSSDWLLAKAESARSRKADPQPISWRFQNALFLLAKKGVGRNGKTAISIPFRSEEHTSELQSLMRISYAVFCLKKKT